jgi:TPR repeat protein
MNKFGIGVIFFSIALWSVTGAGVAEAAAAAPTTPQNAACEPMWKNFMDARRAAQKQAAIDYLKQGLTLKCARAQAQMGEEYRGSDRDLAGAVQVDYKKAFEMSKLGADQGLPQAMMGLGTLYMRGSGVSQNSAEALKWFIKATDLGDHKAPRYAGMIYERGKGMKPDYQKADEYYRKAAEAGDLAGQCSLGSLYERGLGEPQSYETASEWYLKAAARGDLTASGGMAALGNLYETRTDGKRNVQTAIEWYRKAAEQDNMVAKAELARLTSATPRPVAAGRNLCGSPYPNES